MSIEHRSFERSRRPLVAHPRGANREVVARSALAGPSPGASAARARAWAEHTGCGGLDRGRLLVMLEMERVNRG